MTNDFRPTASVSALKARARLLRSLRAFFDERGFFEVQTPVLSHDVLQDLYVEPVSVPFGNENLYLQTSPEFAMKRLLAAGCGRIYEITPAFRRGDRGAVHNVEFTLIEWYREGDGYREGIEFLKELADAFLGADGGGPFLKGANTQAVPFAEVFRRYAGEDPRGMDAETLRRLADRIAPGYPGGFTDPAQPASADDWLDYLFSELVQPNLGLDFPVVLYDYPATQSQLAKSGQPLDGGTGTVARRFELFARRMELANGYDELTDAKILRARIRKTAADRAALGLPKLPVESRLLAAMEEGLPPSSGCALGVDRLLMLRLGAKTIDEVIPFPVERA